jgi:hypothetical protein
VTDTVILEQKKLPPAEALLPMGRKYRLMIWAPVGLLMLGGWSFWHFVSFALLSNPALNGMIFAVMAWGVWTMNTQVSDIYREDRVFLAAMRWLRRGPWSGEQDPKLGPQAFVMGMIERLQKLGLGHQLYIHGSAMEPELVALEHHLEKRQELSNYLVGLMVGLGLLGTFIGLLETLVQTADLIGTIAKSTGGGGGNMEEEFSKIVGGLKGPLSAMGTAFSASMFGLIGSIMLGFQMVLVRKTAGDLVARVRTEVLSLAEASQTNSQVAITERFLSTLLADILQAHKLTTQGLRDTVSRLDVLVPEVKAAAASSGELARRMSLHEHTLARTAKTVGGVAEVVPVLSGLADSSSALLDATQSTQALVQRMLAYLPEQDVLLKDVRTALARVDGLSGEVRALRESSEQLRGQVGEQGALAQRMDGRLWSLEKHAMREALLKKSAEAGTVGAAD